MKRMVLKKPWLPRIPKPSIPNRPLISMGHSSRVRIISLAITIALFIPTLSTTAVGEIQLSVKTEPSNIILCKGKQANVYLFVNNSGDQTVKMAWQYNNNAELEDEGFSFGYYELIPHDLEPNETIRYKFNFFHYADQGEYTLINAVYYHG